MHELLSYLNQLGVLTIVVLAQHGVMGQMQTPIDLSYLSDAVIMLRYFEAGGRVRRAISVVKKRSGIHEDTIREFQLTSQGLKVGSPLTMFSGILRGTPTYEGDGGSTAVREGTMTIAPEGIEQRVLVLAPIGRDAQAAAQQLADNSIASVICFNVADLRQNLDQGAAVALVTEEALLQHDIDKLNLWVLQQPPWSDFPFVVLTRSS